MPPRFAPRRSEGEFHVPHPHGCAGRQDRAPEAAARAHRHAHHAGRSRCLGHRRRRLGGRLGQPGRQAIDRRHPPCGRARRQLDRHRRHLRPRALRRNRARGAEGDAVGPAPAACSPSAGCAGTTTIVRRCRCNVGAPRQHPRRVRGFAQAPRPRAHRPLSDALAGQGRHAHRGILENAARPQSRGQGARRRPFQPQRGAARPRPRRSATSIRCSRRSPQSAASSPPPSCRGASSTTPASSSTARCRPAC